MTEKNHSDKSTDPRERAKEVLRQSEERFHTVAQISPVGIFIADIDGKTVYWNERLCEITGMYDEEGMGAGWAGGVHPEDRERVFNEWYESEETRATFKSEYRFIDRSGKVTHTIGQAVPMFDIDENVTGYVGTITDITERKQAEEQIKAALAEKVVLLREIHHRVKNNLQSLIYLIDMQAETIQAPGTLHILSDLQGRARAMSMVHEKLYQAENLARINFGDYLQDLTAYLHHALAGGQQPITMLVDAVDREHPADKEHPADVFIDVNIATPCGMIVNELVTNALKYAFPEETGGGGEEEREGNEIRVEFGLQEGEYVLTVADNGVGLPPGLDWRATESLGLKLVNIWATYQLEGSLEVDTRNGTAFTIRFVERKQGD